MAQLIGYLLPILCDRGRVLRPRRTLAIAAISALLAATVAPGWAAAAEPDNEGEGTAPAGLEDPHFEPGGEEAPLEVLPGAAESGGSAEEVEGPPIETEPAQEPELPEPAAEAAPPVEPEPPPPSPEATAPAPPEYAPAAPEYVAPAPSSAPVENEPIVAPPGAAEPPPRSEAPPAQPEPQAAVPEAVAEAPPAVVPSSEQETPPQETPPPAPMPAAVAGSGGVSPPLHGRSYYTVRPGDCLWWIAEALLPGGSSNAEIAAEVARLWRLNEDRIGTGDPNVLLVGTVLELA